MLPPIGRRFARRLFPNSVYRVLRRLQSERAAVHVVTAKGWLRRADPTGASPLVLLCDGCATAKQEPVPELAEALDRLCAGLRFTKAELHVELRGTCAACSSMSDRT